MRWYLHTLGKAVPGVAVASTLFLGAAGMPSTGWIGLGPSSAEAASCDVSDMSLSVQEQAFVGLINGYRASTGAGALVVSQPLTQAATFMAQDMASNGVVTHTDSLGRGFVARLQDCGVSGVAIGENVAGGFATPQAVFNAWQASPAHNANMINPTFTQIGVAEVNGYWATDFSSGMPSAAVPPVVPAPVTPPQAVAPPPAVGIGPGAPIGPGAISGGPGSFVTPPPVVTPPTFVGPAAALGGPRLPTQPGPR